MHGSVHDWATNRSLEVYTWESPDLVAHEVGHAALDALQPDLFGLSSLEADAFHEAHRRLFTFSMDTETELVNLRAIALGKTLELPALKLPEGNGSPIAAKLRDHEMWFDGAFRPAVIYDRERLRAGDRIRGPAIVCEMDATTVILGDCAGVVDAHGNILINPV